MTMTTAGKSRETRIRNMARRQGLELLKSRRRDPLAADYGRYVVADVRDPLQPDYVFGHDDEREILHAATLDEVEAWLASGGGTRRRAGAAERVREPAGAAATGAGPPMAAVCAPGRNPERNRTHPAHNPERNQAAGSITGIPGA